MAQELPRTITATGLAVLTVGGVIGSGIFLVPSVVLQQAGGSVGLAFLVWAGAGVLILLGALTYGELGAMSSGPGGLYTFLRDAYGPLPAFLYGWTLFLVIACGACAALAVASAGYLEQFTPLGPTGKRMAALGFLALLVAINVRGTTGSVRILGAATAIKVGVIALLVLVLPFAGDGLSAVEHPWPETWSASTLTAVGTAMIAVLWSYEGWQFSTFVVGEVVEPQRQFPRGLVLGTLALVVIYLAANLAYLAGLGPVRMAASDRVAAEAVATTLGSGAARLVAVAVLISMLSAAQMIVLTSARVLFAMGRDGVFFSGLGRVHPRFGTPATAIAAIGAWAAVLAMTGTFKTLLTYVVFVGWIFYGLGAIALFVFRRTRPHADRPFRVPGYPVTPALFVLAAIFLVGNTILTQPVPSAAAIGGTLLGLPAYFLWKRRGRLAATPHGTP